MFHFHKLFTTIETLLFLYSKCLVSQLLKFAAAYDPALQGLYIMSMCLEFSQVKSHRCFFHQDTL